MNTASQVLFREVQRFRQPWLWAIAILSCVAPAAVFGCGIVTQLVFGTSFGDKPTSDGALVVVGCLVVAFGFGIAALFWTLQLITEVRREGLYVRLFPLHRTFKPISLENLRSCEPRTYRPLREGNRELDLTPFQLISLHLNASQSTPRRAKSR